MNPKLVCLDASAIRDLSAGAEQLGGFNERRRESIRHCQQLLEWLVSTGRVEVRIPLPAYLEYVDNARQDRLVRYLMDVEGQDPGEAFYNRKRFNSFSFSDLPRVIHHADRRLENLRKIIGKTSLGLDRMVGLTGETFNWRLFAELEAETGLWIMDAFGLAAAVSMDVDYFITSDSDFSQEVRKVLKRLGRKVPLFINHRGLDSREFPADGEVEDEKKGDKAKRKTVRRAFMENIFEEELKAQLDSVLGTSGEFRVLGEATSSALVDRGDVRELLWYYHRSSEELTRERTVTVIGSHYARNLSIKEIRRGKHEVDSVSANGGELKDVSLRLDFESAIEIDPCLRSALMEGREEVRSGKRFCAIPSEGTLFLEE